MRKTIYIRWEDSKPRSYRAYARWLPAKGKWYRRYYTALNFNDADGTSHTTKFSVNLFGGLGDR